MAASDVSDDAVAEGDADVPDWTVLVAIGASLFKPAFSDVTDDEYQYHAPKRIMITTMLVTHFPVDDICNVCVYLSR